MPLPAHALNPAVTVSETMTVAGAAKIMAEHKVGAVVVLEEGRLVGVFTERDVLIRVVLEKRDAATTRVAEVMTRNVLTVKHDEDRKVARRLMIEKHIRHLPVLDDDGKVLAMLSMRHLLRADIIDLEQTIWALVAEGAIDGPGG
jgi:CBS domain-containing protein